MLARNGKSRSECSLGPNVPAASRSNHKKAGGPLLIFERLEDLKTSAVKDIQRKHASSSDRERFEAYWTKRTKTPNAMMTTTVARCRDALRTGDREIRSEWSPREAVASDWAGPCE